MKKNECPCCNKVKDVRAILCQDCRIKSYGDQDKKCTKCERVLPICHYRIRTRKNPRPRSTCRHCEALAQKEYQKRTHKASTRKWEKNNPEKHKEATWRRRVRKLGLDSMMDDILSKLRTIKSCQICSTSLQVAGYNHKHTLCIDHCHKTGLFRGILCSRCNQGIGIFLDNPITLKAAADYLTRT